MNIILKLNLILIEINLSAKNLKIITLKNKNEKNSHKISYQIDSLWDSKLFQKEYTAIPQNLVDSIRYRFFDRLLLVHSRFVRQLF